LVVSKPEIEKCDVERCDLKNLSELEVKKQHHVNISNRSAALENLSDSKKVNRVLGNIKEYIRTSANRV
jgi:hypothetical protein